jgi:hypothetical protein
MADSRQEIIDKLVQWKSFRKLKEKLIENPLNVLQWINKALTKYLGRDNKKCEKVKMMARVLNSHNTSD